MGTNRRYADSVDRAMDARVRSLVMRDGTPSTLTAAELALDVEPLTRTPVPKRVRAWVHYAAEAFLVDAVAVAWTSRAVAVKWEVVEGLEHHAWVWAPAVTWME